MDAHSTATDGWIWLTIPIAALLAIAAGAGLFVGDLYRDTTNLVVQARGQDLVTLVVALPTLLIAGWLAVRGSQRARLIWLGALIYTVYTYVGFAFAVRCNAIFLVYVALLGCATYALIGGLVTTDFDGIRARFTDRTPVRTVSVYLALIATVFYAIWLKAALPASLAGRPTQALIDAGTPTEFVQVLDMAWLLPAFVMTAVSLWRGRSIGFTLAGALLAHAVLLAFAVLAMVLFMVCADQPVVMPMVVTFAVMSAVSIALLVRYLNHLKSSSIPPRLPQRPTP
jgi:hypothetical protein